MESSAFGYKAHSRVVIATAEHDASVQYMLQESFLQAQDILTPLPPRATSDKCSPEASSWAPSVLLPTRFALMLALFLLFFLCLLVRPATSLLLASSAAPEPALTCSKACMRSGILAVKMHVTPCSLRHHSMSKGSTTDKTPELQPRCSSVECVQADSGHQP